MTKIDYDSLVNRTIQCIFGSAVTVFLLLLFVPAPYGKFYRDGWGWKLNGKIAWFLFEIIPMFSFYFTFSQLQFNWPKTSSPTQIMLLALWEVHYFHRSIIYTYRAPSMSPQAFTTAFMAALFNIANGFVNGYSLARRTNGIGMFSGSFIFGLFLFVSGMIINIWSDSILFSLRKTRSRKDGLYFIPHGGLFAYVSCPHYSGEIIEWIGWAILSQTPAGLAFAVFTAANLVPRAMASHQWYRQHFGDKYPKSRKAIVPYLL